MKRWFLILAAALAAAWLLKWLLWDGSRLYLLTRPASDRDDGTQAVALYSPLWGRAGTYTPDLAFTLGQTATPDMQSV